MSASGKPRSLNPAFSKLTAPRGLESGSLSVWTCCARRPKSQKEIEAELARLELVRRRRCGRRGAQAKRSLGRLSLFSLSVTCLYSEFCSNMERGKLSVASRRVGLSHLICLLSRHRKHRRGSESRAMPTSGPRTRRSAALGPRGPPDHHRFPTPAPRREEQAKKRIEQEGFDRFAAPGSAAARPKLT